jgi:hypothetical protein
VVGPHHDSVTRAERAVPGALADGGPGIIVRCCARAAAQRPRLASGDLHHTLGGELLTPLPWLLLFTGAVHVR